MKRGDSLRSEFERRYAAGGYFTLKEAVATLVPLITSLNDMHHGGARLFVHPSSVRFKPKGCEIDIDAAQSKPLMPRDRACMAPEERQGAAGDARASVFACGAMLYEMVTAQSIGPGMRRPRELVPALPEGFEMLLEKALVGDPAHRPNDLGALAQALHHMSPTASLPPPPADEGLLDHGADFDVDVSISMLPPPSVDAARAVVEAHIARAKSGAAPAARPAPAAAPVAAAAAQRPVVTTPSPDASGPVSSKNRTSLDRLAELKARLEADPRPRYTVIKEGMDHGPFTAVELLHQIATRNFTSDNNLRDTLSKDERPISDWEEFAPFAEQSRLSLEVQEERKQLEASVTAETERNKLKTFGIIAVALVGLAGLAGLYFRFGKHAADDAGLKGDKAANVDFEGGVGKGKGKGAGRGGGKWAGTGRGPSGDGDSGESNSGVAHPVVPDGMSCEGAQARYVEDYSKDAPPDLTAGAYGNVLNRGDYLNACGVPPSTSVNICAAVQNGHAVGVTVSLSPPNGGIARCISGQVRSMAFPAHPRLDVSRTTFAAQ